MFHDLPNWLVFLPFTAVAAKAPRRRRGDRRIDLIFLIALHASSSAKGAC